MTNWPMNLQVMANLSVFFHLEITVEHPVAVQVVQGE